MSFKDKCKEIFLDKNGKLIPQRMLEKYLRKHGLYEDIIKYYSDSTGISETIYRIVNDIDERPVCKICGQPVTYRIGSFSTYCSKKCSNSDPAILQKNKEGVSKSLKKVYTERKEEILNKRSDTLKEKYNISSDKIFTSPFSFKQIQDKVKETIQERYGVDNVFKLPQYRASREIWQKRSIEYQKTRGLDIEYIKDENDEYKILVHNGCKKHGDVIVPLDVFNNRTSNDRIHKISLCLQCQPIRSAETSIEVAVKEILENNNIAFIQHDRKQISPLELDFYIPEYKVAIECNGSFWHKDIEYYNKHIEKINKCKDKEMTLLYFWDYEIYNNIKFVESEILKTCNKNIKKVFSNECKLSKISENEIFNFFKENSTKKYNKAKYNFGVIYDNEIIECFSITNKNKNCIFSNFAIKNKYSILNNENILKKLLELLRVNEFIAHTHGDLYFENMLIANGFEYTKNICNYDYFNYRIYERVEDNDEIDFLSETKTDYIKLYEINNKEYILEIK